MCAKLVDSDIIVLHQMMGLMVGVMCASHTCDCLDARHVPMSSFVCSMFSEPITCDIVLFDLRVAMSSFVFLCQSQHNSTLMKH
jgi:hypothetical protein